MAELEVAIESSGGDEAAQGVNKVNTALRQSGEAGEKAAGHLKGLGKIEHVGVSLFSKEIIGLVPGLSSVHGMSKIVSTSIMNVGKAFGVALGPIGWVVAAIGILVAVTMELVKHHAKVIAETQKLQQEHIKLIDGFKDAEKAGTKLTAAQKFYADQLAIVEKQERATVLEHMKATIAKDREAVSTLNVWQATKMLLGALPGMHALQEQVTKQLDQLNLTLAKDTAAYVEMKKSGHETTEGMKDQAKTAKDVTDALNAQAKAIHDNAEIMRKAQELQTGAKDGENPAAKWDKERAAIKQWEVAQINALHHVEGIDEARIAVHTSATAQMSAVDKKQADDFKKQWISSHSAVLGGVENLGTGLILSIGKGTAAAGEAFKNFGTEMLTMLAQMISKTIVLGAVQAALTPLTGGASGGLGALFGFQFGGKVPGPEGEPKMAVVHGGETISNPTGKGGGSGDRPNVTMNVNVGGAFASMRELQRSQRRGIRSTGELGLA